MFPGRYQPSIFDAGELNYCVRNGNRWTLTAIDTDKLKELMSNTGQRYGSLKIE